MNGFSGIVMQFNKSLITDNTTYSTRRTENLKNVQEMSRKSEDTA